MVIERARLVTVMISVPEREAEREKTLAQLDALGLRAQVVMTPPDMPRCEQSNGQMGRKALSLALSQEADYVLFCEDDVDVSPSLPRRLNELANWHEAVTLYLPGKHYYDGWGTRQINNHPTGPLKEGTGKVSSLNWWFGSQAILLPAEVARRVVEHPLPKGIDEAIKATLITMRRPLMYVMPNLANHRSPKSVTSARYKPHRSVTYGRE